MGSLQTCTAVLTLVGLVLVTSPAFSVQKQGETGNGQPDVQTVTGKVLTHDKEVLTIKDSKGKDIHLHLGDDTKIPGLPGATFKPGDQVEATVTTDGHAISVRPTP